MAYEIQQERENNTIKLGENTSLVDMLIKKSYIPIAKPPLDGYIHNKNVEKVFFAFGQTTFSRQTI